MAQRLRALAAFMEGYFNSKHPLGNSQPSCHSSPRETLLWPPLAWFRFSILTYMQAKHSHISTHILVFVLDLALLCGRRGGTLAK